MGRILSVRVEDFVTGATLDENLDVQYLPRVGEFIISPGGKVFEVAEVSHTIGGAHVLRVSKL